MHQQIKLEYSLGKGYKKYNRIFTDKVFCLATLISLKLSMNYGVASGGSFLNYFVSLVFSRKYPYGHLLLEQARETLEKGVGFMVPRAS
jgi:hypothetical protein